jgi:hypothetical protein
MPISLRHGVGLDAHRRHPLMSSNQVQLAVFFTLAFPSAACAAVQCALKYGFKASHRFFLIVLLVRLAGLTHTRT